jgi:small subunit ribosomal protein S3
MGQKVNPKSLRLGIIKTWDSRWLVNKKNFPSMLEEDFKIRRYVLKALKTAGIENLEIERLGSNLKVTISAARPGIVIGRGGKEIERIKKELDEIVKKHRLEKKIKTNYNLNINIEEVKKPNSSAAIVAQGIAENIEKRMPYRRVMKKAIEQVSQQKEAKGIKIKMSGRLDGAEISRREWLDWGKMPLQTLRADVDYAEAKAHCTYGIVGIKVWIYKGDIFPIINREVNKSEEIK